jgi:hypothetical protein
MRRSGISRMHIHIERYKCEAPNGRGVGKGRPGTASSSTCHDYHPVDAANANILGFRGWMMIFFGRSSMENMGDEVADAMPTEWFTSPIGVTGPSDEVVDVGDEESEWKGDGGESGGEMYRGPGCIGFEGFRMGTCCNV